MKRAHTIYKNHSILVGNTVQIYKKQSQLRTTETDKYLQRFPKVRTGRSHHGWTGYFKNEIGFFQEFLMKNDFLRARCLGFV